MADHVRERILSAKFTEALIFSIEIRRQRRKGSGIPFMAHLLGVTAIVLEDGGDEEQGIAALLHDAVEDHPRHGQTEREIRERFGARVHHIVMGCTEPDPHALERGVKGPWEDRKQAYIEHLRGADSDVLLVAAADKLYNARSILNDMPQRGRRDLEAPLGAARKTLWYYREVTRALRRPSRAALPAWCANSPASSWRWSVGWLGPASKARYPRPADCGPGGWSPRRSWPGEGLLRRALFRLFSSTTSLAACRVRGSHGHCAPLGPQPGPRPAHSPSIRPLHLGA
jgi:hypothetical protein